MPMPVRSLPVVQNWDCRSCTNCCRDYEVAVTEEERQRILAQGWENDPAMKDVVLFERRGWLSPSYSLKHRPDHAGCVFLDEKSGCRIHSKFGADAKPLACRVYPFLLVPAGDHWRVGMRYACPSVTGNEGRSVAVHQADVREYAKALEKRAGIEGASIPAPMLHRSRSATWPDLLIFVRHFIDMIGDTRHSLEYRLRKCLALINLCREAEFEKVTGNSLKEFLEIMGAELDHDLPQRPEDVAAPGWIGRILFRQSMSVFARKDSGPHRGISRSGRLALLWAAWRFARGTKRIPRVHGLMSEMTFEELEQPRRGIPTGSEALLTRYFLVKIESLQFCGATNFGRNFFDGLESLALTFPSILWLARNIARTQPQEEALGLALRIVDDNFGYNPWLGSPRQLFALRTLSRRGELARLVAWYSRSSYK